MGARAKLLVAAAVAFVVWILANSLFIVEQGQQALLIRLGKPMGDVGGPGLKFKAPLLDSIVYYDARPLSVEPPAEQIILGGQKRLEVETFTQFRIADPLKFYQTLRTVEQARLQLAQIVSSSLRRELGQWLLRDMLSEKRPQIVELIQAEVAEKARPLGMDIVAVLIHRADLPLETSQAIYDRMKSEREREAKELRAQGFEWAQQIKSRADRDRTVMLSEADRNSRIVHGEADAAASSLLSDAFGKDPVFYRFFRSLQSYRRSVADSGPLLMLSPDEGFLSVMKSGPPPTGKANP